MDPHTPRVTLEPRIEEEEEQETRCVPMEDGGDFFFVPSVHPWLQMVRSVRMRVLDQFGEHLVVLGLYDYVSAMPFSDVTTQCIAVPFAERSLVMRIAGNVGNTSALPELIVSASPINLTASAALASASSCHDVCAEFPLTDCRCVALTEATTPHRVVYQTNDVDALRGGEKWFTTVGSAVHFTHFSLFDNAINVESGHYKRVRFAFAPSNTIGGHTKQSMLLEAIQPASPNEPKAHAVINVRVTAQGKHPDLTVSMHPLSGQTMFRTCDLNAQNVNGTCAFHVLSWHDHAIDIHNNGDDAVTGDVWLSTTAQTLEAHRGEVVPIVVFPNHRPWSVRHLHALSACSLGHLLMIGGCGLAVAILVLAVLCMCFRKTDQRQKVPVHDDDADIAFSGAEQTQN